jgi:hypothetical protein
MLPPDLVAKLSECTHTDFVSMRDLWSGRALGATGLVAVGLFLEGPELYYDLKPICQKAFARLKGVLLDIPKYEAPDWVKVVAFVGWILIVAGVAAEGFGGIKVKNLDANIQECSDSKVQAATLEAGDAAQSAKTAHEEADAARMEADAVSTEAKQISASLSMVQWGLGARHVLNEAGLENDLGREFRGKLIVFTSYVQDDEAFVLCKQLASAAARPGVGVITEDECADEPLRPHLPVTDLRITAPTIDEAERLGMIIKRAGVAGWVVNVGQTPEITVLVGHQAAIPLFWPKMPGSRKTMDKMKNESGAKP